MKKLLLSLLLMLALALLVPMSGLAQTILGSAVPLRWSVETSRAVPATFEEYAGASYDLEATLTSYGEPLSIEGDAYLFWQTNGMASAYWQVPATVTNNVLKATWLPEMDVGAKSYNCFIGVPGTVYNAAFQLRLRPSPGAVPSALPLPVPTLDFQQVTVLHAPYYQKSEVDAALASKQDTLIAGDNITIVDNVISSTGGGEVSSVNGKTGVVTLAADDVNALPATRYDLSPEATIERYDVEVVPFLLNGLVVSNLLHYMSSDGFMNIPLKISGNAEDIADLQTGKADASHTHSYSDITNAPNLLKKIYFSSNGLAQDYHVVLEPDESGEIDFPYIDVSNKASYNDVWSMRNYILEDDLPPATSNIVTQSYIREKLGVYLYIGEDGGIYVHTPQTENN